MHSPSLPTPALPLRGYAASISRDTGVTDPELIAEIEDWMRQEQRTLDHLSPRAFADLARSYWEIVAYLRTPAGAAEWARLQREMAA